MWSRKARVSITPSFRQILNQRKKLMGWAQKAYDDDKDEWNDIKKEYKITEVLWDVYSQEARFVRALIKKTPGLRGKLLKLDVYHEVAKQKLYNDQFLERKQLIEALAVLEKLA